jgi:hypothetical protein
MSSGSTGTGAAAAVLHPAATVQHAAQQTITTLEIDEAILSTPFNFGWPNIGFFNTGFFNVGAFNVGDNNVGDNNIGEFLTGNGQIGIGTMSV